MKTTIFKTNVAQWIYGPALKRFSFLGHIEWLLLGQLFEYDRGTADHSVRVVLLLADQLFRKHQLPGNKFFRFIDLLAGSGCTFEQLIRAALLHDIGKIKIAKKILFKTGKLSDEDKRIIGEHAKHSENILMDAGFTVEAKIAGQHHHPSNNVSTPFSFYCPFLDNYLAVVDLLIFTDLHEALLSKRAYKPMQSSIYALAAICNDSCTGKIGHRVTYFMASSELRRAKVSLTEIDNLFAVGDFLANEQNYMSLII